MVSSYRVFVEDPTEIFLIKMIGRANSNLPNVSVRAVINISSPL